jgi:hypothetical protein
MLILICKSIDDANPLRRSFCLPKQQQCVVVVLFDASDADVFYMNNETE